MNLPSDDALNMMWSVSTSDSLESGTEPHVIFAKLLYNRIIKTNDNEKSQSQTQKQQSQEQVG